MCVKQAMRSIRGLTMLQCMDQIVWIGQLFVLLKINILERKYQRLVPCVGKYLYFVPTSATEKAAKIKKKKNKKKQQRKINNTKKKTVNKSTKAKLNK